MIRGRKGEDLGGNQSVAIVSLSTLMTTIGAVVIDEYKMIIKIIILVIIIIVVMEEISNGRKRRQRDRGPTQLNSTP